MKPRIVTPGLVIAHLSGATNPDAQECLECLAKTPNAWRLGGAIDGLRNMAKGRRMSEGRLIYDVLRVFYGGMNGGVHNALAEVCALYWQLNRIAPPMSLSELATQFKQRSAAEWHAIAMAMISDAQVALAGWIESWNRKQNKLSKKLETLH